MAAVILGAVVGGIWKIFPGFPSGWLKGGTWDGRELVGVVFGGL